MALISFKVCGVIGSFNY